MWDFYYWYLRYLIFKVLVPKAQEGSGIYTKYSDSVLQVPNCCSQFGSHTQKLFWVFLLGIVCQLESPNHSVLWPEWALWRGNREVLVRSITLQVYHPQPMQNTWLRDSLCGCCLPWTCHGTWGNHICLHHCDCLVVQALSPRCVRVKIVPEEKVTLKCVI